MMEVLVAVGFLKSENQDTQRSNSEERHIFGKR